MSSSLLLLLLLLEMEILDSAYERECLCCVVVLCREKRIRWEAKLFIPLF